MLRFTDLLALLRALDSLSPEAKQVVQAVINTGHAVAFTGPALAEAAAFLSRYTYQNASAPK